MGRAKPKSFRTPAGGVLPEGNAKMAGLGVVFDNLLK
jgi:hypothetical protein